MIGALIRHHLHGIHATSVLDVGPGYADFSRITAEVTGAREITFLDVDKDVLAWQMAETERLGLKAIALPIALGRLMSLLSETAIFLAAAVICVPLFRRLKLGAVLGYLFALL